MAITYRKLLGGYAAMFFIVGIRFANGVTVVATQGGGPTPQQLADNVADSSAGVTVVASSVTTAINNGASTASSPRSMGAFANGLTASGTPLPAANDGPNNDAVYSGGIGITAGVLLCTGAVTDTDASDPAVTGRGVGTQGPNNGIGGSFDGEIGQNFQSLGSIDADFRQAVFTSQGFTMPADSSDPVVLQFDIQLENPGYLRISSVFGSDEYPAYIQQQYNDSFAILVKRASSLNSDYENVAVLNDNGMPRPFTLQAIFACDAPQFVKNQVAPEPVPLPTSPHAIKDAGGNYDASVPLYDHEFGGFTSVRTWETQCPLAPGTYTVKIVIHDVADGNVDAGLFVMQDSLKLYAFLPADFNLDGEMNAVDFGILLNNFLLCGKKFSEGDADGDGCVDPDDFNILLNNFGATGGNRNLKFDFDRDNDVDGADLLTWQRNLGLSSCASRFEGDADADGDVDASDNPTQSSTQIAASCGGSGPGQSFAASGAAAEGDEGFYDPAADFDRDLDVDRDDLELFAKTIAQN